MGTTVRTVSFIDLVTRADPDFYQEANHPIVYKWPKIPRRDPGADGGPYANSAVATGAWVDEGLDDTWVDEAQDDIWVPEVKG